MKERSRAVTIIAWILQILAAAAFLSAGIPKLLGNPMMVDMFNTIGVGQWFRYVTGGIEVGSAFLLLLPGRAVFGAILLICTMAGAILTHLLVLHTPPTGPVGLLILVAIIAWLRWDQIRVLGQANA
jgi:putative oxidoreductase